VARAVDTGPLLVTHQRAQTQPASLVSRGTIPLTSSTTGNGLASFFHFKVPGRPTGVTATAFRGDVELVWQPARGRGLPIVYHVIPSPACAACRGINTPTRGASFITVTGLILGHSYRFAVQHQPPNATLSRLRHPETPRPEQPSVSDASLPPPVRSLAVNAEVFDVGVVDPIGQNADPADRRGETPAV
jgi:hypothetical protein